MNGPISSSPANPVPAWILLAILAFATIAAMIRVPSASLIDLDDDFYVSNNAHVLDGLTAADIGWAFTTNHTGYWMPLTWVSLQLDATLSGPPAPTPPGQMVGPRPRSVIYHLDNLFEHVAGALLLLLFLDRATKRRWMSFAIALLWAVHPLRVESVAWITERKDVLAGLFGFLSLYLYVLWSERRQWPLYAGICVSMALSLLAKPLFVTLPCVLLLLDYWPLHRLTRWRDLGRRVGEKAILFGLAIAGSITAFLAQHGVRAVMSFGDAGIMVRLENALLSYVRYLWMQVSVADLGIFYPYLGRAPAWEIAGAAALLAAITILALLQRRRRPWLLVGWLWYLGTLVPMIGIVQVGQQAYADRFTYLPSVGLLMMLLYTIPPRWLARKASRAGVLAGIAIIAIVLAGFTIRQVEFWQNPIGLDQHTIAITRSNYVMYSAIGNAYLRAGRPDLAASAYERSIAINPSYVTARLELGTLGMMARQFNFALPQFAQAVALDPDNPEARNLYGVALAYTGQIAAASQQFAEAVRLKPQDPEMRRNLQMALHALEQAASTLRATTTQHR